jgi:hypothetical protein
LNYSIGFASRGCFRQWLDIRFMTDKVNAILCNI